MKKILSMLLLAALSMNMLVACSSDTTKDDTNTDGNSSSTSSNSDTDDTATDTEVKTVMMADGEKELPEVYGNFAILDWGYLDHLTMLDVTPVASPITSEPAVDATAAQLVSYLDGYGRFYPDRSVFDDIIAINATDDGIDFEQLLDLDLDYIITSESNIQYSDKLNAIAPTYFLPTALSTDENGNKDWKQIHQALALLTDTVELAEANIEDYDNLVADYKAAFEEAGIDLEGQTAIVTQISTKGVQYSLATSHPHVYDILGLSLPENFPTESGYLALENLVEYDPDYLFINVESWEDFAEYESSPIWQNLTAVQNGNVFEFAHNVWNRSNGSMAAFMRVTDVGDFILDGTQVTNRYDYIDYVYEG